MWTRAFWRATAERAIKSAAQAGILALGGDLIAVWDLPLLGIGGVMASGAVLSVLTSLASDAATGSGPSLTSAEKITEQ